MAPSPDAILPSSVAMNFVAMVISKFDINGYYGIRCVRYFILNDQKFAEHNNNWQNHIIDFTF